jgi:uncharacterized membrane protein (UPF0127 family)
VRLARVENRTRNTALAERAAFADNYFSRFLGLMGRKRLAPGEALFIVGDNAIHSLFMRFRFDAAFLSADGEVLHIIHSMKPWRASKFVYGAKSVLELPAGALLASQTEVGDHLGIEEYAG